MLIRAQLAQKTIVYNTLAKLTDHTKEQRLMEVRGR